MHKPSRGRKGGRVVEKPPWDFSMLDNSTLFTFVACTEILALLPNLHWIVIKGNFYAFFCSHEIGSFCATKQHSSRIIFGIHTFEFHSRCTVKLKNAKQSSINTCYVNIKHKKVNIYIVLATKSFKKILFLKALTPRSRPHSTQWQGENNKSVTVFVFHIYLFKFIE